MKHLQKFAYALLIAANMQIGLAAIRHSNEREGVLVLICSFAYLLVLASHNDLKRE